jgi:hypothetical protein
MSLVISMFSFTASAAVPANGMMVTVVAEQTGSTTAVVRLYVTSDFSVDGIDIELTVPDSLVFVSAAPNAAGNWGATFPAAFSNGVLTNEVGPADAMEPLQDGLFFTANFTLAADVEDGDEIDGFVFVTGPDFFGGGLYVNYTDASFTAELSEPADNVLMTLGRNDFYGESQLIINARHDGLGRQDFYFVIHVGAAGAIPARLIINAPVTEELGVIQTGLIVAPTAQVTVWAIEAGPFGLDRLGNDNIRMGMVTTN